MVPHPAAPRCSPLWTQATLVIREAVPGDKAELAACLADLDDLKDLTGWEEASEDEAQDELDHRDLPPGGRPENDRLYLLWEAGLCVGYAKFYEGAPDPETVWLGMFGLKKAFRGRGLSQTLYSLVEDGIRSTGYPRMRLNVGVRNLPALRFWIRNGFTTITAYHPYDKGFLDLTLEKRL